MAASKTNKSPTNVTRVQEMQVVPGKMSISREQPPDMQESAENIARREGSYIRPQRKRRTDKVIGRKRPLGDT